MLRKEKEEVVDSIAQIFEEAKSVFLTDFEGLNVELMEEFRHQCREASVNYRVIKNTLGRLAAKKAGQEEIIQYFEGSSAIAYSYDDPSAPARVISEFTKKAEKPKIKVTLFEGSFYGPDKVKEIASLPSKEILLAKLVGGLNSPIQNFVGDLYAILQKLVLAVNAIRESKS
jgi:large subunit ribosomal protein L10